MKTNMTNDTLTVDKKAGELTLNFHGVHKEPIKFQTSMKRIGKLQTKLAYSDGKRMFSISDKESQSVEFSIPEDMDAATLTADIKEAVNLFGGAGFGWREGKLMLTGAFAGIVALIITAQTLTGPQPNLARQATGVGYNAEPETQVPAVSGSAEAWTPN